MTFWVITLSTTRIHVRPRAYDERKYVELQKCEDIWHSCQTLSPKLPLPLIGASIAPSLKKILGLKLSDLTIQYSYRLLLICHVWTQFHRIE